MAAAIPEREATPDDPPLGHGMSQPAELDSLLTARRARVVRLRRELLVGDTLVIAAVVAVGGSQGQQVIATAAGAVFVLVAFALSAVDTPRSMIALRPVVRVALLLSGAGCAGAALFASAAVGREVLVGVASGGAALVLVRLVLRLPGPRQRYGLGRRRWLLVGEPSALEARALAPAAASDHHERIVVRTRAERAEAQSATPGLVLRADSAGEDQRRDGDDGRRLSGVVARVVRTAVETEAERVTVIPSATWGQQQIRELSWSLEGTGMDLVIATGLDGIAPHRAAVTQQDGGLVITVGSASPHGSRAMAKAAIDRCAAVVLLALLVPLLLMIGVAVRLDSPGPAIFRQTRVREGSRMFTMYKFRTMRLHAEQQLGALQGLTIHAGPLFKMEHDPRVTRLGRLLRRTSLDELPQLVNVVKGEMSLIGPRPALPVEVASYDFAARRRLAVKPGMTGLWQVSGRSRLSWDESIGYDLHYVDNWSAIADASIAVRTLRAVVRKDGAF